MRATVQIFVIELPKAFDGYDGIHLVLSTADGHFPPTEIGPDYLRFDAEVEIRPDRSGMLQGWGPAVNRQGDGVRFIYLSWLGTQGGFPRMFRRMKVGLDQVPGFPSSATEYQVRVKGTDKRGGPACARCVLA